MVNTQIGSYLAWNLLERSLLFWRALRPRSAPMNKAAQERILCLIWNQAHRVYGGEASAGLRRPARRRGATACRWSRSSPFSAAGHCILFGLSRRHPIGLVPALAGGLLIARAATLRHPSQETARGDDARPARRDGGSPSIPQVLTGPIHVEKTISINRSPEELYAFWHDFANLPRFMQHLESVQVLDEGRSHWVAKAPAGTSVEWDAEITEDQPRTGIAWRSLPGAEVENAGTVLFTPAPQRPRHRGARHARLPAAGGRFGAVVAKLFGEEPSQQVDGRSAPFQATDGSGRDSRPPRVNPRGRENDRRA